MLSKFVPKQKGKLEDLMNVESKELLLKAAQFLRKRVLIFIFISYSETKRGITEGHHLPLAYRMMLCVYKGDTKCSKHAHYSQQSQAVPTAHTREGQLSYGMIIL